MVSDLILSSAAAIITLLLSFVVASSKYQALKAKISAISHALHVLDAAMADDKISREEISKIYEAFKAVVEDP